MPTVQSPKARRVAVFDVCNTLFSENTTAGFVEYYCRENGLRSRLLILKLVRERSSPIRTVMGIVRRLGGPDLERRVLLHMLAGQASDNLNKAAELYVDYLVDKRKLQVVWPILEREMMRSVTVLASASICVVINNLAKRLGAAAVCSQLEFVDGYCTGRLALDASGRKGELIAPYIRDDRSPVDLFVCTDNVSDTGLLEMAHEGIAVCHAGRRGLHLSSFANNVRHILVPPEASS